jgi:hypothetical protein
MLRILLIISIAFASYSCRNLKEYFRDPETEYIAATLSTAYTTAYAANIAMSLMQGNQFPFATMLRSNPGYPCTSVVSIEIGNNQLQPFINKYVSNITVIGLWADENTAILNLLFSDFDVGNGVYSLLGIKTIPVVRTENNTMIALAEIDVSLNPDTESLFEINLTTGEIESELFRLDAPAPADVYVAVTENAYLIQIDNSLTYSSVDDDIYTVSGGGQLVKVDRSTAEVIQQGMVGVTVSGSCSLNPTRGMAIMQVTGVKEKGFPELGSVILNFQDNCNGLVKVFLATGMYAGANGRDVEFRFE